MADAHYAVVAPHNAGGPVCSAISMQLGACIPNFYIQESFDETNEEWTKAIVDQPIVQRGGYIEVRDRAGLGIELDWDRLRDRPYQRENRLRLFSSGWERRTQETGDPSTADQPTTS